MGSMIVHYKGDRESKYLPNVSHEMYVEAEKNWKFGEIMFLRYRQFDGGPLKVYIIGESAVKNVASLAYLYN